MRRATEANSLAGASLADSGATIAGNSSATGQLTADQKLRLVEALDQYLYSLEDGVPLDCGALVEQHPDLSTALRAHLQNLAGLHEIAAGFTPVLAQSGMSSAAADETRLGDYVLLRELGRGGMGVVYEARQVSLCRRVA